MASPRRFLRHQDRAGATPSALDLRESRCELAEQARSEAPDSSLSRNWNNAVAQELTLLFRIDNVYCMAWVKEAEFGTECFGDLARVGCDLRSLRRHRHEHLHQKVARGNIGGIERTNKANLMLWVGGMKPKLLVEFADRRLLRGLAPLELAAWKGDLSAVSAPLRAANQQHLAVEWMRVNTFAATGGTT